MTKACVVADSIISFEQYADWAMSRYPGYREEDELTPAEVGAYAETVAPASDGSCPVTVRSEQHGRVVLTPRVKRSR